MSNKIFLRIGSWYRATDKALLPDIDMSAIIQDVNAEYPVIKDDGGGGSTTLQQAIDNGAVLDKDNTIDGDGHSFSVVNASYSAIQSNITGEDTYSSVYVQAGQAVIDVYDNDTGDEVTLKLTPNSATIDKGAGAKEIATEEDGVSGTFTSITSITVVNGIITDIQGT